MKGQWRSAKADAPRLQANRSAIPTIYSTSRCIRYKINADGSVTVTILQVREALFVTVSIGPVANETIETAKVWSFGQTLYVESSQLASLRIYTMAGELFKRIAIPEGLTTIQLPRGIYTVLLDGKGVYKVIIQ